MQRLDENVSIKRRTRTCWRELFAALPKERAALPEMEIRRLTASACREWAARSAKIAGATRFNGTISLLRHFIEVEKRDLVLQRFAKFNDPTDRTCLEACRMAADGIETDVWADFAKTQTAVLKWSPAFARITWRLLAPAAVPGLIERVHAASLSAENRRLAFDTLAFIGKKEAVMTIVDIATGKDAALAKQAKWWLFNRGMDQWKAFGTRELLKERGIYDPDKIVLVSIIAPPAPKESKLPPSAEIAKLKGDAARGKLTSARCTMCHKLEGVGIPLGPELVGWVKDQGVEAFFAAVSELSQGIAHGYERTMIDLKDGGHIDGIAHSIADPVVIESMGGVTQVVPRDRIQKMKVDRFKSLMLSADQLGITAQDLADLAAYLKTL